MLWILYDIQKYYYPILVFIGLPVNVMTLVILSRGKCGLSRCVTHYLMLMSVTDLLIVILDLIMRRLPVIFSSLFWFVVKIKMCNIHAVLLYAVTDCSVWYTVAFTIDRYVAICCPKLKPKYCTKKKASVIIAMLTVICCLKNIFWYFILGSGYTLLPYSWFCYITNQAFYTPFWATIQSLHYILTPGLPFCLILLLNSLTIRHILVANRARQRIRGPSSVGNQKDSELESRKNSIVLLFVVSGNFILLWVVFMANSIYVRIAVDNFIVSYISQYTQEIGFMLQLLSCCTNTFIYAVTQRKFREDLQYVLKYPTTWITRSIKHQEEPKNSQL
ncbi:probable G-protein coupled receptor 139 [Scyliorhinus torazame]|uniref:probable G-protein coupled receptor 139 n=1 Tax=Scyliorhinus torazame TaxID=75743 RepID=UPI003B5BC24D